MENRNLKIIIVVSLLIIVIGIVSFIVAYENGKITPKGTQRTYVTKEDFKVEEENLIEDEELNKILEKRDDLKLKIEDEKNLTNLMSELETNNNRILEIIDDIQEEQQVVNYDSLSEEEQNKYNEQQMKREELKSLLQERQKTITKIKDIIGY